MLFLAHVGRDRYLLPGDEGVPEKLRSTYALRIHPFYPSDCADRDPAQILGPGLDDWVDHFLVGEKSAWEYEIRKKGARVG